MVVRFVVAVLVLLIIAAIVAADYFFKIDAIGNLLRYAALYTMFLWRLVVAFVIAFLEFLWSVGMRIGLRRLMRPLMSIVLGGVSASYYVRNKKLFERTQTARARMRRALELFKAWWFELSLSKKIAIVIVMIALQAALHFYLILFPVAFIVTYVVTKVRDWGYDESIGAWYWRTFGSLHRRVAAVLRRIPGIRAVIGGIRYIRLCFLGGWREWKYHFCTYGEIMGRVYLLRNIRRWGKYCGRPLLAGRQNFPPILHEEYWAREEGMHPVIAFAAICFAVFFVLEYVTSGRVSAEMYHFFSGSVA